MVGCALLVGLAACDSTLEQQLAVSPYPGGHLFAFTITDDPDHHRLDRIRPVYDFLTELGLRTSVGVFTLEAKRVDGYPDVEGYMDYDDTTERGPYRDYLLELQSRGFEVFLHTASAGNDRREDIVAGYNNFRRIFGHDPVLNLMHSNNLENVYWGSKVFSNPMLGGLVERFLNKAAYPFRGDDPASPYFWGDILQKRSKYVRLWGTSDINTLRFNPSMPYHDPAKPYVNYWFSFSDGNTRSQFNTLISRKNVHSLAAEHGSSIVYTHFGAGFTYRRDDKSYGINDAFRQQMTELARQPGGWFVPAAVLLDRLLLIKNVRLGNVGDSGITIANSNPTSVESVSLFGPPGTVLHDCHSGMVRFDAGGAATVGDLAPGASVTLYSTADKCAVNTKQPEGLEYVRMVLQRAMLFVRHNWHHIWPRN